MEETPASLVYPGRGAGTGAAGIYGGSNLGILGIYQQGARLRAAAQQAEYNRRTRAKQEEFKQLQTSVKLDDNTAPIYQDGYSQQVQTAKQDVLGLFNEQSPTYIADPFQRQAEVAKRTGPVMASKRLSDDDWERGKQTIATAKGNPELNGNDLEKAWHAAHYTGGDPVAGTLIAPADLPTGYHEALLNDPRFINQATATDKFFKAVPGSQEYSNLMKGRPGTYSEADDLMTRLAAIEPDGKGGHQVKMDANGRPVLRDPLGMLNAAQGTKFGALLDNDMAQYNAKRAAVEQKMANYEPLTDEDKQYMQPKTKLDFLTDRALGHVVIKSKESKSYIPLPRPRAAAAGKAPATTVGEAVNVISDGYEGQGGDGTQRHRVALFGDQFGAAKAGGKPISVDAPASSMYVIGAGGEKAHVEQVSGSVKLKNVRSHGNMLFFNDGRPVPLTGFENEADAERAAVEWMRDHPGERGKVYLAPAAYGEVEDKAKTAGSGGRTLQFYSDAMGEVLLDPAGQPLKDAAEAAKLGGKPVYDDQFNVRTRQVIVPSSQAMDRQIAAQVPGWSADNARGSRGNVRKAAAQYGFAYRNPYKTSSPGKAPAGPLAPHLPGAPTKKIDNSAGNGPLKPWRPK